MRRAAFTGSRYRQIERILADTVREVHRHDRDRSALVGRLAMMC
jgi:hypothetical protein